MGHNCMTKILKMQQSPAMRPLNVIAGHLLDVMVREAAPRQSLSVPGSASHPLQSQQSAEGQGRGSLGNAALTSTQTSHVCLHSP